MEMPMVVALVGGALLGPTVVSLALCSWVRHVAPRFGWVDRPGGRKIHQQPTPLGGGVAVWAAVMLAFLLGAIAVALVEHYPQLARWLPVAIRLHLAGLVSRAGDLAVVLIGGTLLMLLGLYDDRRNLPWQMRLAVQFLVAGALVISQGGDWQLTAFLPWRPVTWGLSILWIVALVNAFNMLDNMDGLSAGVAAIIALLLAVLLLVPSANVPGGPQLFVGGFLLVLAGSLLGFLWHNRPPARLFLGDAGSYFIGFSIAVASLVATYTGYESPRRHAVLAPVCLMAVPLYDMLTVIAIRLWQGRSPFEGDKNHFSHRLVELGFSRGQAVLLIYLVSATCGLAGLALPRVDLFGAGCLFLMVVCVMWVVGLLEFTARRNQRESRP
ncbi:MAG: undecaprenyl-phosphate alpha-N-acetylglucosaminyl 1-phosphate transferase [Pirellulaceae bacterium]|nr:MAG: undecaprenyl-phosphate alpha-N-acetylglucosaminyl 1-phosphate transferase [Pirellulaceae bacterium]GIW96517.1 MAG: undecaprenyl-phosphate alpha-N-acetylglucosaminyl 1-phosphate transferase [Pirellulaceae bacterium]